jgi:uncharacterized protein (TIGR02186 family)
MLHRLASTTITVSLFLSIATARADDRSNRVRVEPDNVSIGIFYSGQKIRVKASAPASRDIVIRVSGPEEPLVLKKKGRKLGLLWMNVGKVRYEAVPTLYLLSSSRKLDEIAAPETLDRLKLGFDALKDRISADSEEGARELFGELVKLKQRDHLFSFQPAGVQLQPLGSGRQEARGEFFLPAKTPVGEYTVDVFDFHAHQGELLGSVKIRVKRTPVVSWIASLAADHGLLYGCVAVALAVLAGLFTGFLFSR